MAMLKALLSRMPGVSFLRGAFRRKRAWDIYVQDFKHFKEATLQCSPRLPLRWSDRQPCLSDRTPGTAYDRHYIYHTAWAARKIREFAPTKHVDISSHLFFNAILAAFVPVDFYDYRPPELQLKGLNVQSGNLTKLPFADGCVESLSCLHVVEHVGLGRYGDPLDPEGDLKAMAELKRVLADKGNLLFVVPVGRPRICFNAHRVYAYQQIMKFFAPLELKEFALVPDDPQEGGMLVSAPETLVDQQTYGCGCFWFEKSASTEKVV